MFTGCGTTVAVARRLPTSARMATIAAMEPDARPRERLAARGAEQLTDGELLAIVLGDRDARRQRARGRRGRAPAGVGGPDRAACARRRPSWPRIAGIGAGARHAGRGGAGARAAGRRRASYPRPAAGRRVRGLDVFSQPAGAAVGRGVLGARPRRAPPRAERDTVWRAARSPASRFIRATSSGRSSGRRPPRSSSATTTRRAIRRPRARTSS